MPEQRLPEEKLNKTDARNVVNSARDLHVGNRTRMRNFAFLIIASLCIGCCSNDVPQHSPPLTQAVHAALPIGSASYLWEAARPGHVENIDRLLAEGAQIEDTLVNYVIKSAVLHALDANREEKIIRILHLLLKHGARTNIPDNSGMTPLQLCKFRIDDYQAGRTCGDISEDEKYLETYQRLYEILKLHSQQPAAADAADGAAEP